MGYRIEHVAPSPALTETHDYELSDVDTIITPIHMVNYYIYRLSENSNRDHIANATIQGLSKALTQAPIFAGRVFSDKDTKRRPFVRVPLDAGVEMGVRTHHDTALSMDELESRSYPPSALRREVLLPPSASPSPDAPLGQRMDEPGVPALYSQLNFIPGGLLFSVAFYHLVADAWTCHRFLSLFTSHARLIFLGNIDARVDFSVNIDRGPYQAMRVLSEDQPEEAEQQLFREFLPSLQGYPAEDLDAAAADVTPWQDVYGILIHVPGDNARRLKKLCAPLAPEYVSTYDCCSALAWRVLTRARVATGRLKQTDLTASSHVMNQRGRHEEVLMEYIGNASSKTVSAPLAVSSLLAEGGLAEAAQGNRRAILKGNMNHGRILLDMYQVLGAPKIKTLNRAFSRSGLVVSSWQQMKAFEEYDFGFGLPVAFRSPGVVLDGGVVMYPTPPGTGVLLWIGSSKACIDLMENDQELLDFAIVKDIEKAAA